MGKNIHHGEMFVSQCREGGYQALIPTVWDKPPIHKARFSKGKYRNPKLMARMYADKYLKYYYGEKRADYIASIPQFVKKMQFGCGVNIKLTTKIQRKIVRTVIDISWSEYNNRETYRMTRRRTTINYSEETRIEAQHRASLLAAKKKSRDNLFKH
ncbi:hypothetical protein ACTTZI_004162 [Vibrio vulnificus]